MKKKCSKHQKMAVNSLVHKFFKDTELRCTASVQSQSVPDFRCGMSWSSRGCCHIQICPIVKKECFFDLVRKESTGSADTGFLFCKFLKISRLILFMSCDVAPGASAFPVASRGLECVFHVAQSTTRARLFWTCCSFAMLYCNVPCSIELQ